MYAFSLLLSYIDPVSGVILLQLIIGGGLGCVVRFRRKIWLFCTRFFSKQMTETEATVSLMAPSTMQSREDFEPRAELASLDGSLAGKNTPEDRELSRAA